MRDKILFYGIVWLLICIGFLALKGISHDVHEMYLEQKAMQNVVEE